jgi:hypothetical protein
MVGAVGVAWGLAVDKDLHHASSALQRGERIRGVVQGLDSRDQEIGRD